MPLYVWRRARRWVRPSTKGAYLIQLALLCSSLIAAASEAFDGPVQLRFSVANPLVATGGRCTHAAGQEQPKEASSRKPSKLINHTQLPLIGTDAKNLLLKNFTEIQSL